MIFSTLRSKIIANSLLIILIIASTTFYTTIASSELSRSMDILFSNNVLIRNLNTYLNESNENLTLYLSVKSTESLNGYLRNTTFLTDEASKLNQEIRADDNLLLQRDLAALIKRWIERAEASIVAKRGRDIESYSKSYAESQNLLGSIQILMAKLDQLFIADSINAYQVYSSNVSLVLSYNMVLIIVATLTGILLLLRFSYRITSPLVQLSRAAGAVARGTYDTDLPMDVGKDEIGTTIRAFASMQQSIMDAIENMKTKAEVEKTLMEERLRALDMDRRLKDTELLALQTQINPHFLFNTLYAGLQLAQVEGAQRTEAFLENLAGFIRYALRPPSRQVLLSEEIDSVRQYIWLLQLRFRERFDFAIELCDDDLLDQQTPALILQPLVENAVTHGLKDRESGGKVIIKAERAGDQLELTVTDNGDGIEAAEIDKIYFESLVDERLHDGGIGLRNVIRRIYLHTGELHRIIIKSIPGKGTTIGFRLDWRAP